MLAKVRGDETPQVADYRTLAPLHRRR
jgi:hypothetical protein